MNEHEKQEYSVGIVGMGFVGNAMHALFPEAICYDKYKPFQTQAEVYDADIIFVCVPTNALPDGQVDLSHIKEVLSWLPKRKVVVIKSTLPPHIATDLIVSYPHRLVFNPEFLTEKHWEKDIREETRVILGGDIEDCKRVARVYQKVYSERVQYVYTTPKMSMMVKYVSNAFLALKVGFVNEIAELCKAAGVDYDILREYWLLDLRVGRSHTLVSEQTGFGGYCLPKDLQGLIWEGKEQGIDTALLTVLDSENKKRREKAEGI